MSYELRISHELDAERGERPPEVRKALAVALRQLADQHSGSGPAHGQLELSLKDENDFDSEYFRPSVDWIPGHVLYRWQGETLVVGDIHWPDKYPWAKP